MYNPYQYQAAQPNYFQGYNPQNQGVYGMPKPQRTEVIRVHGRQGIEALAMAENSSVLCMDETAPVVWLAQTDGAGFKTVYPFEIKKMEEKTATNAGNLLQRFDDIETRLKALERARDEKPDTESFTETDGNEAGKRF